MTFLIMLSLSWVNAQEILLTNPAGLNEPYQVQPGTEITVTWSYFDVEPTNILTYNQDPGDVDDYQYSLNSEWTQHTSGWTDNGDGTFSFNYTVNEPVWIWGSYYTSSNGYAFSNVISIGIASPVVASSTDGIICPNGGDTEVLTVDDVYSSYQWYHEGVLISGATSATYDATEAGYYYVVVDEMVLVTNQTN